MVHKPYNLYHRHLQVYEKRYSFTRIEISKNALVGQKIVDSGGDFSTVVAVITHSRSQKNKTRKSSTLALHSSNKCKFH